MIVPDKPRPIEINEDPDFVKQWLIDKYLPYQNWLLRNNLFNEEFIQIGDTFSEWFYTNWEDIKTNSMSLVSNWLYNNASTFNNKNKINII